jgi:C-terminal processing protease CtpA/Prc
MWCMRVFTLMLAVFLAFAAVPAAAVPPAQPSREDALVTLCRLWNAVRFTHPALTSESDASWEDALIAAEPMIERDPTALKAAAAAMLAALHDPLTAVESETAVAPTKLPGADERDGVHVTHLNGYPDEATAEAYGKALAAALVTPASDRALVVDLRAGGLPSFDQIAYVQYLWSHTPFVAHVASEPVAMPVLADRYFLGFPPEAGTTSGDYREGRETVGGTQVVAPATDARAVPIAFVVDANSVIPEAALALQRAGRAAIFSADASLGIMPGAATPFDAGAGLIAGLRTSAPLDATPVRRGALDAALAWVRDPKPGLIAAAAPPAAAMTSPDKRFADKALPDEAHRVLAAFRIWGTIEYLFPYKNLMHDDWDAALHSGLADLHGAGTPLEYERALLKMYAHIHDTHGFVAAPAIRAANGATPAFLVRDVEGRPTIVRVDPVAAKRDGFTVGDVVEAVDGEAVGARAARLRPYVVASTEQSAREQLDGSGNVGLFAGPPGSSVTLRLRGADGRTRDVRTVRVSYLAALRARTRPVVEVLAGNIGYVDLQRLEITGVDAMFKQLESTRAIVFDLRGYPRGTAWRIAPHLTAGTVTAALFRTPVSRFAHDAPNSSRMGVRFRAETRDFEQLVNAAAPRYAKPVVVVIDARAISQSEHTGLYLAASAHARFVGEPTVGANGDVTSFFVPGGVQLGFTGQAVMHPEGAQLQRVGLVPDVRVSPTLRGVRAGEDELLAAGLREALRLGGADAATVQRALTAERASERADARMQLTAPEPKPTAAP